MQIHSSQLFPEKNKSSSILTWGTAALLGPVIAGLAIAMTATYVMAYGISAILLFGAFLLAMSIKEKQQKPILVI